MAALSPAPLAHARSSALARVLGSALPWARLSGAEGGGAMSIGLIGRKVGMTQVFQDDGTMIPVSVVAIEPNTVTRLRTARAGRLHRRPARRRARRRSSPSPRRASSRDLPQVAVIREFRVEDLAGLRGRPDAGRQPLRRRRPHRRHRDVQGQGLRRHDQAPQLPPRPEDPRLRPPSRARLDRTRAPRPAASTAACRMAGHMGDERITVKKLQRRARRPRTGTSSS